LLINSLLDQDLYKLSMMSIAYHRFPLMKVKYKFVCRNKDIDLVPFINSIRTDIRNMCCFSFTNYDMYYLESLGFFKPDFLNYLRNFKLDSMHVDIVNNNGIFELEINGTWLETILFEVPVLAIINENYFKGKILNHIEARDRLEKKVELIKHLNDDKFKIVEFGTRRRASGFWQDSVVKYLHEEIPNNFVGTSNIGLAQRYGVKAIGTMAHEYIQAFQAIVHPKHSQLEAFNVWSDEYRGDLGIALTDTINMDNFLRIFDKSLAKLYDGLRHDSGNPCVWARKAINHYKGLGIDPKTKSLVFSDNLNVQKAIDLYKEFNREINVSFGIGTNLTNDCGEEALNIVIKLIEFDGLSVAKISDQPSKGICSDENYLKWLKSIFGVPQ